uniref:Retrovirus-related Pol polyprotein LINE-1 n=1 Tax=Cajanus cajan TaxID=3821 RepID=A0A151SF46_CAJCA|nr:Retrovirus-related Pol polyprotein LINE-1 [Cajanus cajan]
MAKNIQKPWCIIGDFNAVLKDSERKGGSSSACFQGDNAFKEFVLECHLEYFFWFQKSRCKWLEFGDRNTSYFHGTTVIRRRKNKIVKLQNEEGVWIENKQELEHLVTDFYKNLFHDSGKYIPYCLTSAFPSLTAQELEDIAQPFSDMEIHGALKRMGGLKAPGPDGFQAIFYQSQWNTVGKSLCRFIHACEQEPRKISEINATLITLIPKVDNVVSLQQMWPISLCNVSYKVITKVLASRLRKIMEGLVSHNQCSFVPHRQTTDNIIITQEVIHSMKRRSGKKGWMAIKIDLEKAYDRLKWKFIKDTLEDIGLPK